MIAFYGLLYFFISLMYTSYAMNITANEFKIIKGIHASMNVIGSSHSRSTIACAEQCSRQYRCTHANFKRDDKTCEMMMHGFETSIWLSLENAYTYICK